jgi:hypothetical protein
VVLLRRGADAEVILERFLALAEHRPADVNPRVVVGEHAGVFLVARRIAGDFAELEVVGRVGRILERAAVLGIVEVLVDGLQGLLGATVVLAGAAEDAPGLALDVDLAFLAGSWSRRDCSAASNARVYHAPSQACSSTVLSMSS